MTETTFFVSAPGKIIIFGEHSAVYGKPAIAAALSLRAYLQVSRNDNENEITLKFPDIDLSYTWNKHDIPWTEIRKFITYENGKPVTTEELVPEIVDKISNLLGDIPSRTHFTTCLSFLYLYTHLCTEDVPGNTFCIRSTLPIGAGLGSSASTGVCLAAALSVLSGKINSPTTSIHDKSSKDETHQLEFIDNWSLMGEKCFHGNPSGIDNAVATYGGAVMFQRVSVPSQPSIRTTMRNFPSMKLLLTNTKIPRSTADLVGGVAKRNSEYPKLTSPILDAMGNLASEAYKIMTAPEFGHVELETLRELVEINHGLLVAIGVSHPALEKVKVIADINKIGATKLTGAGGGGCAITLIDESSPIESIHKAINEFGREGFDSFETSLGGKGVAMLTKHDVSEENRNVVFSLEEFSALKDSISIEHQIGTSGTNNWKYW
ncbi:mevalonate kinase [Scheffersomyces amazonensis]|uniref:mevalonate kinase n=1 Tax=Scheffersomyces amazonensis TaxID=1078765 RepID=UPI00315D2229